MAKTKSITRVSVDLGDVLNNAVTEAAAKLGLTKAETMRRAAAYLNEAIKDKENGYSIGSWKELENAVERKVYVIA